MTACCVHFPFLLEIQIKILRELFEFRSVALILIVNRKLVDFVRLNVAGEGGDHPFWWVAEFGGDVPLRYAV